MVCTTTSTKARCRALTLVELLVATAISGVLIAAVMSLTFYSARSFAAMANYVDLDNCSRNALDVMSREIRQADCLVSGDDHQLVFRHTNPGNGATFTIGYTYNPDTRVLARLQQGGPRTVLLDECDFLKFSIYQRNPMGGPTTSIPPPTRRRASSFSCPGSAPGTSWERRPTPRAYSRPRW